MLFGILLTLNIIVCLALIAVVLLQRSEGGALGMGGGGAGGFMSARGAGDMLTRTTWILFAIFLLLSLGLTLISGRNTGSSSITDSLKIDGVDPNSLVIPAAPAAPATPQSGPDFGTPPPVQAPMPSLNPLLPPVPADGSAPQ
jgi:preprotein translocase subunit SecG